ncbi:MAG: tetratricopeptide repeat protein [Candidatus Sericytochromatia bacterium]|nr:tetratricopeptide repeat protein [Candidatus Sericytochromatia bacterium]
MASRTEGWVALRTPRDRWRAGHGGLEVLGRDGAWLRVPLTWVGRSGTEGPEPGWSAGPIGGRPWLVLAPDGPLPDEPGTVALSLERCHELLGHPGGPGTWPGDAARAVRRGELDLEAWLGGWGVPPAAIRPVRVHADRMGARLLAAGRFGQLELKDAMARQMIEDRPLGVLLGLAPEEGAHWAARLGARPAWRDPLCHPWLVTALWGMASWAEAAAAWHGAGWDGLDAGWMRLPLAAPLRARAEAHVHWLGEHAGEGPRMAALLAARGVEVRILSDALARQIDQARPLGHLLVASGHVSVSELVGVLAEQRMERRMAAWDRVPPPPPPLRRSSAASDSPGEARSPADTPGASAASRRRWWPAVVAAALLAGWATWLVLREGAAPRSAARLGRNPGGADWLSGATGSLPMPSGRPDRLDALMRARSLGPTGTSARFEGQAVGTFDGSARIQEAIGRDGLPVATVAPEPLPMASMSEGAPPSRSAGDEAPTMLGRVAESRQSPTGTLLPTVSSEQAERPTVVAREAERGDRARAVGRPLERDRREDMVTSGATQRTGSWVSEPLGDHRLQAPTEALREGATAKRGLEGSGGDGVQAAQARFRARLALSALAEGDRATARQAFEEALRDDPALASAHWHLGELALERGDVPEARRHWAEYLRLAPQGDEAAMARQRLQRHR